MLKFKKSRKKSAAETHSNVSPIEPWLNDLQIVCKDESVIKIITNWINGITPQSFKEIMVNCGFSTPITISKNTNSDLPEDNAIILNGEEVRLFVPSRLLTSCPYYRIGITAKHLYYYISSYDDTNAKIYSYTKYLQGTPNSELHINLCNTELISNTRINVTRHEHGSLSFDSLEFKLFSLENLPELNSVLSDIGLDLNFFRANIELLARFSNIKDCTDLIMRYKSLENSYDEKSAVVVNASFSKGKCIKLHFGNEFTSWTVSAEGQFSLETTDYMFSNTKGMLSFVSNTKCIDVYNRQLQEAQAFIESKMAEMEKI